MKDLWFNKVGNSPRVRSERVTIQQPTAQINTAYARPSAVAVNDDRREVRPNILVPIGPTIRTDEQKKEDSKKRRESFIKCFDEYKIPECVKDYYLSQQKWRESRPDISSLLQRTVTPTIDTMRTMDAQIQKIMGEHQNKQPKASKCAQDFLTAQEEQRSKNRKKIQSNMAKNAKKKLDAYSNITGAGCEGGVSCDSCSTCGGGCKYADCRNGCCMQKMTSSRSLRSNDRFTNMDGRGLRRDASLGAGAGGINRLRPLPVMEQREEVPITMEKSPPRKLVTCDEMWAETLKMQGGKMIPATEMECLEMCVESAGGRKAIKSAEAIVKRLEENYGEMVASLGKEQADIKIANAKAMICVLKRTLKAKCDVHKKTFLDKYKFWILGGIGAYLLLKK